MGWRQNLERAFDPVRDRWTWPREGDFNGDGAFTISDAFQAIGWIFHAPGDGILYALLNAKPETVRFLELSYRDYGSTVSVVISFFAWIIPIALVAGWYETFKADRELRASSDPTKKEHPYDS
jgi:hypothetical protein